MGKNKLMFFAKGLKNPMQGYHYFRMLQRRVYYKIKFNIFNRNVHIGKNFRIFGKLCIRGPGKVFIGDNVEIQGLVTPWTHSREAEIFIGSNSRLHSTRFGSRIRIVIGQNCIFGDECRIMDTDFHSIYPGRRDDPEFIKTEPVIVGDNVWVTMRCVILKGVTIGANSTVLPNSTLSRNIPEWSLCGGNPAAIIKKIDEEY